MDTQGKGVERITATGVVANGTAYPLDCLIFATGFEVGTDYERRAGYRLVGRGGETLTEKWRDGVRTFHSVHIHGFPNCFMMSIAQSGFTVNFPYMIDQQAKQIAYVVARALREGFRTVEATEAAEAEWVDTIVARSVISADFAEQCTPGYYNNEGMPTAASRQNGFFDYTILGWNFAAGTLDMLVRWRGDGGHCPIHRHTSTTTVLVLAGEQHLWDLAADGTRLAHRVRRAGDYALTVGEAMPHLERGGSEGGGSFGSRITTTERRLGRARRQRTRRSREGSSTHASRQPTLRTSLAPKKSAYATRTSQLSTWPTIGRTS